jgi:hypothetical protein
VSAVDMIRGVTIASMLLAACVGCGEPPRARVVPATRAASAGDGNRHEEAVTKPPRAIATH